MKEQPAAASRGDDEENSSPDADAAATATTSTDKPKSKQKKVASALVWIDLEMTGKAAAVIGCLATTCTHTQTSIRQQSSRHGMEGLRP